MRRGEVARTGWMGIFLVIAQIGLEGFRRLVMNEHAKGPVGGSFR
jgi:hypothetical protein